MLFDSRTVYLGASRDKYEQYCKALDSEKIKYKTKRVNHEEKMISMLEEINRCMTDLRAMRKEIAGLAGDYRGNLKTRRG